MLGLPESASIFKVWVCPEDAKSNDAQVGAELPLLFKYYPALPPVVGAKSVPRLVPLECPLTALFNVK
jgi:hypothetical protein